MKAFTVCLLGKGDPDSPTPFKELFNGVLTVAPTDSAYRILYMNDYGLSESYTCSAIIQANKAYQFGCASNGQTPEDVVSVIVTEMK